MKTISFDMKIDMAELSLGRIKDGFVAHISKKFLPVRGGVEVVVDSLCKIFFELGFNNIVISTEESVLRNTEQYRYARLCLSKSYADFLSLPLAPGVLLNAGRFLSRPGLVFIHYPFPLADLAFFVSYFLNRSKVIVYWHSEIYSQKLTKWFVFPFTFFLLSRANRVLVASPSMVEHSSLLTRFHKKVLVVPYGLPDLGEGVIPRDDEYFLAIGRHVAYKGFSCLIRSMAYNDSRLIIVGDGPLFDAHRDLIVELGIEDRIELKQRLGNHERDELIANCSALILPSIFPSEAFALVQIEAMRYSKPIINTRLKSGVPWVARHNLEAITVEPQNMHSLNNAVVSLAMSPGLRRRLGANGRKRFLELFTDERFKKNIVSAVGL